MSPTAPTYRPDVYATGAILDPYPHYRRMRELGPVVWLPRQRAHAVVHHAPCKEVLLADDRFRSERGVALNPVANRLSRGTTLNSDDADHERRRRLLASRLTPKALRSMREEVDRRADAVVEAAVSRGEVDGVGARVGSTSCPGRGRPSTAWARRTRGRSAPHRGPCA
ncbi:hypothetical protein [Aeromicrobium sp. REDSEA-S32_B7]|uniref:hypothetical protein n=1 Tax=Aeromicrobium sp. REDSEA-S32_B7 TaxID=1811526 RepID=UPI000B2242A8|nr:hypothetical protein [Aeromicrobium sp. REDSEA-S32_B7]